MKVYTTEKFMKKSKSMCLTRCTTTRSEPTHTHEFIELVYILSGRVTHEIDGCRYSLRRGDMLFMNLGCTHAFFSDTEYCYVNILFSPKMMADTENAFPLLTLTTFNEMRNDADFGKLTFFGKERTEAEEIINAMLREYKEQPSHWEQVLGNYLQTLLIKMLRKTEQGMDQKEISHMWRELSEYIDRNLDTKLTLSSLAEKCFYNPSYFSRSFKEKFGMTMTEYITKKRLDRAVSLLSTTDLSLEEISEQAGFSDRAACTHAFAKYLGTNPKDYRKK